MRITILETFVALIKGQYKTVNQLFNNGEISYSVNGKEYDSNSYWNLKPVRVSK